MYLPAIKLLVGLIFSYIFFFYFEAIKWARAVQNTGDLGEQHNGKEKAKVKKEQRTLQTCMCNIT